jgi:hypothetical protein
VSPQVSSTSMEPCGIGLMAVEEVGAAGGGGTSARAVALGGFVGVGVCLDEDAATAQVVGNSST